jgi:chemotaxis protein MotB
MEYGIEPKRMSAVGYGEFQPLSDNANEDNRARNRRVVLLVSRTEMKDPDVVGGINEEKLYEEIDSPLIQFDWDEDKEESEEIPTDIEGVKTIKLKDGGYRFTNEANKSASKKAQNQGRKPGSARGLKEDSKEGINQRTGEPTKNK